MKRGRKHSLETRLKMSLAHRGKRKSAEHRQHISEAKRKRFPPLTPEQRKVYAKAYAYFREVAAAMALDEALADRSTHGT